MDPRPSLIALLLADGVYEDAESGKFVVAGVFHRMRSAKFPALFPRSVWAYVSLSGLLGTATVALRYVDRDTGDVLLDTPPVELESRDATAPISFCVEVPPLPLPHAGLFSLDLLVGGERIGRTPVLVTAEDAS